MLPSHRRTLDSGPSCCLSRSAGGGSNGQPAARAIGNSGAPAARSSTAFTVLVIAPSIRLRRVVEPPLSTDGPHGPLVWWAAVSG
ncbi:hypothetical protein TPA0910_05760 [Streptomyces hygroscopicus subsp. sporocinereus]|uniref:Uncharacterized protein n=1 Tax=Streptomyces hygroscopicus TaxID=1912 RepID=A0ABQ3TS99_STRHY|nr:hypothetical protein TPA0910_05760 [Streptomyces hygroscopicus]